MTTVLRQTSQDGRSSDPGDGWPELQARRSRSLRAWMARNPAWPVVVVLAGWPVWWSLGIEDHIFTLMCIPVIRRMYLWRAKRTRTIRVPPGFGIWLLFLVVMLAGISTIGLTAPETVTSPVGNRVLAWAARAGEYIGVTAYLLYAGNLTERELPRKRLAWLLGLVGIYSVAGGMLGVIAPSLRFTSPLAQFLPKTIQQGLAASLNPGLTQVQGILGYAEGRVKAPFDYTNTWGNCIAILLPWLLVAWWSYGNRRQRRATLLVMALALVTVMVSLDRGLWIGLGVAVFYLAFRYAAQGRLALLGALCGTLALVAVVIVATPFQTLISQRLAHPTSNTGRASQSLISWQDGLSSPFVGYGDSRHSVGSASSIAIGKTANCPSCGNHVVGANGQLDLLLICTGLLGTALYLAFFLYGMWRYRRDKTPYGMVGELVLLLGFVFMFVYDACGPPLGFTMFAVALLWKNDREMRQQREAVTIGTDWLPVQGRGGLPSITAGDR